MSASASMNLLTVEPVPTPTISPGTTYCERGLADQGLQFVLGHATIPGLVAVARNYPCPSCPTRWPAPSCSASTPKPPMNSRWTRWRALQNTPLAWACARGARGRPGRAGRPALSQPRRPGRRPRQERALHRRAGRDGLRLRRGRHGHAQGRSRATPSRACSACRSANALINRLGFNNDGLDAFVANVQRASFRRQGRILGLNIGKNAATPIEHATDDYLRVPGRRLPACRLRRPSTSPAPTPRTCARCRATRRWTRLLGAPSPRAARRWRAQHGRRVPLFVKIAPDLDEAQVEVIAATLRRHGMDGVIATNTTLARDAVQGLPHAEEAGGLSGAPVLEASNRVIAQLRAALGRGFPDHRRRRRPERATTRVAKIARRRRRGADLHRPDLPGPGAGR